jgi:hypothetical protein
MESVQVDNTPISYRCGRVLDLDGLITCRGILVFQPGQLMQRCEECCTWLGVGADHLTPLSVQTGAATGARDKWTISKGHRFTSLPHFMLECGVPGCHFKRHLEACRVHASAVNTIIDEHPCPQPAPEPVEIEALPMAEEKEPGPDEYQ